MSQNTNTRTHGSPEEEKKNLIKSKQNLVHSVLLLYAKIRQKIALHSRFICENKHKDENLPVLSAQHRIKKGINVVLFYIQCMRAPFDCVSTNNGKKKRIV